MSKRGGDGPKPRPLVERFWPKVNKDGPNGCWVWTASCNEKGYGKIGAGRRGEGDLKAHRVAYELTYGAISDGVCVLHKCDNPPCCNPEHLSLGTKADNNADMRAKGRHIHGQKCPWAKLTDEDVKQIRLSFRKRTQIEMSRQYGVSRGYISKINVGAARPPLEKENVS